MAWNEYISNNLMCPIDEAGNTLTSAAILGLDGGTWAHSAHFPEVTVEQVHALVSGYADRAVTSFTLGDVKYLRIPGDETIIRGRKEKTGFIARKSAQAIVIGFYTEPNVTAIQCGTLVEALADYLVDQGY